MSNGDLISKLRAHATVISWLGEAADALEATDTCLRETEEALGTSLQIEQAWREKAIEAEDVIAEALELRNIDYGLMDIALERVREILSGYKPANQEEP